MADWIDPYLGWITTNPIQTTDLRRMEGNSSHLRDGETTFSGRKTFAGVVDIFGEFISRSQAILREVVLVQGAMEAQGNVIIGPREGFAGTGNLTVHDTITANGSLDVNGPGDVSGALNVGGNVDVGGTLDVVGTVTVPAIDVPTITNVDNISGNPTIDSVTVTNNAIIGANTVMTGSLRINSMGSRAVVTLTLTNIGDIQLIPQGQYYVILGGASGNSTALEVRGNDNVWRRLRVQGTGLSPGSGPHWSDGANLRIFKTSGTVAQDTVLIRVSH